MSRGHPKRAGRNITPQATFPIDALPPEIADYCKAVAKSLSVHVSVPASAALVACASATGLTRVAWDPYAGWEEPPGLWVAMILPSGGRKTPVLKAMFFVHEEVQKEHIRKDRIARQEYDREKAEYDRDQRRTTNRKGLPKPQEPEVTHVFTTDATPEAVVRSLQSSDRGLVVISDELRGFFGQIGRYTSGSGGAEESFWLSAYSGGFCKVDRASKPMIFVEKGLVSIVGGVQPGVLTSIFDGQALASGMAARFLMTWPVVPPKEYGPGPGKDSRAAYEQMIRGMFALRPESCVDQSGPSHRPLRVPLAEECRPFMKEFVGRWSTQGIEEEQAEVEAAMCKQEGMVLRIALLLKTCREVRGEATAGDEITCHDLQEAARVIEWYRGESRRCYALLGGGDDGRARRRHDVWCDWIKERGGEVTSREWARRSNRTSREAADRQLLELTRVGRIERVERKPGQRGGRPAVAFRLVMEDGVSSCTSEDQGTDGAASGQPSRFSQSPEVSSCVMQPQSDDMQANSLAAPVSAVDAGDDPPSAPILHDETSGVSTHDSYPRPLLSGDEACMTHDETSSGGGTDGPAFLAPGHDEDGRSSAACSAEQMDEIHALFGDWNEAGEEGAA